MKRYFFLALLFAAYTGLLVPAGGQASPDNSPHVDTSSVSGTLQPTLDRLGASLNALHLEKWKASGAVRDEAAANVASIRRDLQSTLPQLLTAADAAPSSVATVLPVFRNVDALYDVYLRVVESAQQFAPRQQGDALEQARTQLEGARRGLGDRLQSSALAQERQVASLRDALNGKTAIDGSAPCAPQSPAKKRRKGSS